MSPAEELPQRTDLALWGPAVTLRDVEDLCRTARDLKVRAVCVPGSRVELANARLEDSGVKTVALIGFPFGGADGDVKRFEAETAYDHGAQEVEFVLNTGKLKDGDERAILRELRDVAESAEERPLTVAIETGLLTREETILAVHLVLDSGATAICNGTGFIAGKTETFQQIKLMREAAGPRFELKCANISDRAGALAALQNGATRIGTPTGIYDVLTRSF